MERVYSEKNPGQKMFQAEGRGGLKAERGE